MCIRDRRRVAQAARDSHGTVVAQVAADFADDHRYGVGGEAHAEFGIKIVDGFHQADAPDLKQVCLLYTSITGRDTPEEALRVLAEYFEHPLVKLDKDGCLILEDGRPRLLRNIPEFTCKDSTGAGDAFLA